jgi:hypothetical protein
MKEKNAGEGPAKVDDVLIKGVPGEDVSADVVITLSGVTFKAIAAEVDVTEWFGDDMLDNDLSAEVKDAVASGATSVTITVSGEPDHWNANALEIKIPRAYNSTNLEITVDENDDARYDIAMRITNKTDFVAFVNEVNTNNKLTLSAVLASGLEIDATTGVDLPIAKNWRTTSAYQGDFDGNGGKIKINLVSKTGFLALFAVNNGTIHGLTVCGSVTLQLDPDVDEADYIAGVVAYNDIYGTIKRVINKAAVMAATESPTQPETTHNIGGIAGFNGWDQYNDDSPHAGIAPDPDEPAVGLISQCQNEGAIEGGFNKIGGIAGENAGDIKECSNTGEITCVKAKIDKGWPGVGGITGRNGNNNNSTEMGHIINCYNWGKIVDDAATATEQNAYGGITGWCDIDSTVKNCYTTGEFSEDTGSFRGTKNPIIGMVDDEPPAMSIDNYSLETIDASSKDLPLIGTRLSKAYMESEDFVNNDLNKGGGTAYKFNSGGYPKLSWE